MEKKIEQIFQDSILTKQKIIDNHLKDLVFAAELIVSALKKGKKILVCGNGGSAADSQHFVAELLIRFEKERKSLPAIDLTSNSSNVTAGGNDYGYNHIFERQISALGQKGDVLIGITTSGNSINIINAFLEAKNKGLVTICLNGKLGGEINKLGVDSNIIVPSNNTARIQESHITIIHSWCFIIDQIIS